MSFVDSQQSSTISSSAQAVPSIPTTAYEAQGDQWTVTNHTASSFAPHFPDNFLPPLETFEDGIGFPANAEAFLGPDPFCIAANPMRPEMDGSNINSISTNDTAINGDVRRQKLLEHFVQSVNPTKLMQPTHTEWTSACRSLIAMAHECTFLLSAICSLSALHLYCTAGDDYFEEAFRHYRFAGREVNNVLDGAVCDDRQLKQAFAAIFLLTYTEVSSSQTRLCALVFSEP